MDNEKLCSSREALLREPYRIIDILPDRTPERFAASYSALERYCFRDSAAEMPYTRFLDLIVKLGCYCDTALSRPDDDEWVCPPEPELLLNAFSELAVNRRGGLQFIIGEGKLLVTLDAGDLYMTVYGSCPRIVRLIRRLARSEGLFVLKKREKADK